MPARLPSGVWQASSEMHDELKRMTPLNIPLLLLSTDGDVVLDHRELAKLAEHISNKVEAKSVPNCRHDMLLNYTAEDNEAVLMHILTFLKKI